MRIGVCASLTHDGTKQAEAALGGLSKASMTELKSFPKPHADVLRVMQAVNVLMVGVMPGVTVARREWRLVRQMMAKIDHFVVVRLADVCALVLELIECRGCRRCIRSRTRSMPWRWLLRTLRR